MGLSNSNQSTPKTYINIVGGKLAVKAKSAGEVSASGVIAKTRIAKNKQTGEEKEVHEFIFDNVSGILEAIQCEKNEALRAYQYLITIDDVGEKYIISIPADSKYGDSFVSKLHNIKAGEHIMFAPYDFEDANKTNIHTGKPQRLTGITITQNGVKLAAYYTKENPNGRPEPSESKMDEDDFKIHMTKVRKFYRGEVSAWNIKNGIEQPKAEGDRPTLNPPKINEPESGDDLNDMFF